MEPKTPKRVQILDGEHMLDKINKLTTKRDNKESPTKVSWRSYERNTFL